jgi:hypothetical protein
MIDPDRIEYFLAGESLPAEAAQLRRDVSAAGGEPAALDAMDAAWFGPGRLIADVVDRDAAWGALARRLSLPHTRGNPPRRRWRRVPAALLAFAFGRGAVKHPGGESSSVTVITTDSAPARTEGARSGGSLAWLGRGGSAVLRAVGSMTHSVVGGRGRAMRGGKAILNARGVRTTAIVAGGLALTAAVWAFAWRQAQLPLDSRGGKPTEAAHARAVTPHTKVSVAGRPPTTADHRSSVRTPPGSRSRDLTPLAAAAKN